MIKAITAFNPAFKQRYTNYDGRTGNGNEEAINQAKTQMQIRTSVENAIKNSDDASVKSGDVYYTLFSDGSCKLSKDKVTPIYCGKAYSVNANATGWIAEEIYANHISQDYLSSSDSKGSVKADGCGSKFAILYPNGDIYIKQIANVIFPEKDS